MHNAFGTRRRSGGVVQRNRVPLGVGPGPLESWIALAYEALVGVNEIEGSQRGRVSVLRDGIVGDEDDHWARGV